MFTCSASPAGSWPSLLRARGNTPPLIKLMSVEVAIFNHFDILGTKEMLFPPSGGLDSIKAAPSVKINTLLGGWFFSLSPPWRNYCFKGVPARGELYCRLPDICFVPFALSAECPHLKIGFISCCLERVFLCWYPTAHPGTVWVAVGVLSLPLWLLWGVLPLLLAGTGEHCGCQTEFEQLLSLCISISFALLTVFPICLGNLTDSF